MRAIARILATMAAVVLVSLVLAGTTIAADPSAEPTIGGALSRTGDTITVKSNGNRPVHVRMEAELVTLSESAFDLQPGETHTLTFTGTPLGTLAAHYNLTSAPGGDSNGVTLQLTLKEFAAPFDFGPFLWLALIIAAVLLLLRRFRPWRYRLTRVPA